MKGLIRKILFGESVINEYLKITIPGEIKEKVFLEAGTELLDVSKTHWLLCIEPVIFGVWIEAKVASLFKRQKQFNLYFNASENVPYKSSATLELTLFDFIEEETGILVLLKVQKSVIKHLNPFSSSLLFSRYYKKNGLTFSKFKAFVAAYSYPRQIRIVSYRNDAYYNIFPMDLLGEIESENRFVFGLRHTNLALTKIVQSGRIAVSDVPFHFKDVIYELGKHHSSNPLPNHALPFKTVESKNYGFLIPSWAENYREIKILKTKNLGTHMLLWGESQEKTTINPPAQHLFLIHFLHYVWQKKNTRVYPMA